MRLCIPIKRRSGYTADHWIDGNGSAIAVDPDPNTVALASLIAAGRVFYQPRGTWARGNSLVFAHSIDGTSITGVYWVYDDLEGIWIRLATAAAATTAGANQIAGAWIADCKYYFQVTANNGVTKVAVTVR